ncbi:MAG: DUF2442 domain-containing protein [Candidatus Omnitrophota bacterium]|jgi:hypothetical protein|nr:MAG: DUF2442 domain-containing protein [Candidatus Omnitrophota bacterium]
MLKDIVEVRPLMNYKLYLRFEDHVEGEVDLRKIIRFTGIFSALKDHSFFNQVCVNSELGTICWPNDADLDPDVLYAIITKQPLPNYELKTFFPSH